MFKAIGGILGLLLGATIGFLIAAWIGDESFAGGAYAGILFGIPLGGLSGSAFGVWHGSKFDRGASRKTILNTWFFLTAVLIASLLYFLREAIDRLI